MRRQRLLAGLIACLLCWPADAVRAQTPPEGAPAAAPESAPAPAPAPAPAAAAPDGLRPMEVFVNGSSTGTWAVLERGGELFAPAEAFEDWRVQLSDRAPAVLHRGIRYLPLAAVPGYSARVDDVNLTLHLLFPPHVFPHLRLGRELASAPALDPVLPSAFLNYDLSYTQQDGSSVTAGHDLGLVGEAGFSSSLGVLVNSFVGRNLDHGAAPGTPHGWTRLETTFTRDFPELRRTLRLGDASTRQGLLGSSVYFGGIQLGSNFALTPGFISQPLPVMSGLSTAPSTVELYVNDVLRQVSNVPAGPFTLENFPVITGGGVARLVVRDILGRETVIVQSFFSSAQLLAPGLNDWSVEAGALRQDLGVVSDQYGPGFGSGIWRHGLLNTLTLEGRAEATGDLRTIGLGAITALPAQTLGRLAWMGSEDRGNPGRQWLLGLEKQGLRSNFALQTQGASRAFRQLGQAEGTLAQKLQLAGNATYTTASWGTFGLGFAQTQRFDAERISTLTASHSIVLPGTARLNVNFSRALNGISGNALSLTLSVPLDGRKLATAAVQSRGSQADFHLTATHTPELDQGLGWRVLAGEQGEHARGEGGVYYAGRFGRATADVSATSGHQAVRLGASGGAVLADGHLFATRRVDQSFAVVEVAGYGDVGVGLGHAMQTRTDASGVALLPRLLPYQSNAVRLNASELPISAELDSIEHIAVPAARSAVKVVFPVRSGRGALLKIVLDDGAPAPAGAVVTIDGDKEEFYVARRGEAFVTGLKPANRLHLSWKERQCSFDLVLPPANGDQIPRMGPFTCPGVAR